MANTTILCLYRKQNSNSTNVFQISSTLGTRNSTEQGPNRHVPANCTNSTFPPLSARPRLSAGPVPIIRSPVFRTNRKLSSSRPRSSQVVHGGCWGCPRTSASFCGDFGGWDDNDVWSFVVGDAPNLRWMIFLKEGHIHHLLKNIIGLLLKCEFVFLNIVLLKIFKTRIISIK